MAAVDKPKFGEALYKAHGNIAAASVYSAYTDFVAASLEITQSSSIACTIKNHHFCTAIIEGEEVLFVCAACGGKFRVSENETFLSLLAFARKCLLNTDETLGRADRLISLDEGVTRLDEVLSEISEIREILYAVLIQEEGAET